MRSISSVAISAFASTVTSTHACMAVGWLDQAAARWHVALLAGPAETRAPIFVPRGCQESARQRGRTRRVACQLAPKTHAVAHP